MADITNNPKGFKVIKTSLVEMSEKYTPAPICDSCNQATFTGYIICVLNQWYCQKCYDEFNERQRPHPEDAHIEEKRFSYHKHVLGL